MDAGLHQASRAGRQIKKCSSIHSRPGALALVTTGPLVTTCFGIIPGPSPVFSPEVAAATGLDSVGVVADSYHMNIEAADPQGALVAAAHRLSHVQVSDPNRLEPGAGHLDWAAFVAALTGIGYAGDLAAECRLRQGKLWAKAGDNARAFDAYKAVVERFANDGTSVVDALAALEQLLKKNGHPESVVGVYQDAFRRISRPENDSRQSFRSSNFFRVGMRYASALEAAGRKADAERVRKQLERGE